MSEYGTGALVIVIRMIYVYDHPSQVLMDLIGVLVTCLISSALLPVDQRATAIDLVRVQDR